MTALGGGRLHRRGRRLDAGRRGREAYFYVLDAVRVFGIASISRRHPAGRRGKASVSRKLRDDGGAADARRGAARAFIGDATRRGVAAAIRRDAAPRSGGAPRSERPAPSFRVAARRRGRRPARLSRRTARARAALRSCRSRGTITTRCSSACMLCCSRRRATAPANAYDRPRGEEAASDSPPRPRAVARGWYERDTWVDVPARASARRSRARPRCGATIETTSAARVSRHHRPRRPGRRRASAT